MGYYRCALMGAEGSATALGATSPGTITSFGIPGEWCSRRSIWPLTMITILSATGWHAGVALLVQAFMIGAALGVITLAAWRTYGLMSAVLIAWIGGAFALEWALGTFMTENWGLVAGFTGAALLMEHAKRPRPVILALGLAMTSIALAARAGALFVLPLLFVWGYSTLLPPGRRWSAVALGVTAAALFVGPALQWAGSIHYLGDVSNTGGNFSTSLYGLSTGSRDWSEAYRDFKPQFAQSPEAEVFKVVQQRAIDNILTHPAVFIGSLKAAGGAFIASIFAVGAGLQRFYYIFAILLVIGTLYSLYQTLRTREAVFALPLVFLAAECMAAPLIVDSGGQRVFAATFWVRPLLVGVGATFAITLLVRFIRGRAIDSTTHTGTSNFPWPMASLAGLVVVASAVPLVAPSGSLRPRPVVDTFQCDPGEIPVIARLGRESMALSVGFESALPLAGPLRVTPGQLERHHHWYNSWWSRGTGYLTTGATIVLAFDARPESRGQLVSLFSERALPPSASGLYRVCAGDELERSLGDFPLRSVSRFEPAE
jgi:hypothetical protein